MNGPSRVISVLTIWIEMIWIENGKERTINARVASLNAVAVSISRRKTASEGRLHFL